MAKVKAPPTYPDFIIIGAPEAGGDIIKAALAQNPKIWFPPLDNILALHSSFQIKRLDLARQLLQGDIDFKITQSRWLINFFFQPVPTLKWYSRLFKTKAEGLIKGEFSDEYVTLPFDEVEKLRQTLPKVKIILMIRNPVDRSFAALRTKFMYNKKMPFSNLSKRQLLTLMNSDWARTHSSYQNALDSWLVFFPHTNIMVGFYDDLIADPASFMTHVQKFIGLEGEVAPNIRSLIPAAAKRCPDSIVPHLHKLYYSEVEGLARRLGGAAHSWLDHMPAPARAVEAVTASGVERPAAKPKPKPHRHPAKNTAA